MIDNTYIETEIPDEAGHTGEIDRLIETSNDNNALFEGSVDHIGPERIFGWIRQTGADKIRLDVIVTIDDKILFRAPSDGYREDLRIAGIGDGYYGFNFPCAPGDLEEGGRIAILARLPDSDIRHVLYEVVLPASGARQYPQTATVAPDAPSSAPMPADADSAHAAGRSSAAANAYRAVLLRLPADKATWLKLGQHLAQSGDLAGAESVYREALAEIPDDCDLHLNLGDALRDQYRMDDAATAYRRSFVRAARLGVLAQLRAVGGTVDTAYVPVDPGVRGPVTYLDISDLLDIMKEKEGTYGIQRVQLGLLSYLFADQNARLASAYGFATWYDDLLWIVPAAALKAAIHHVTGHEPGTLADRKQLLDDLEGQSLLLRPRAGDVVVITGSSWRRETVLIAHARLKRAGVRLGACIYDFLSLSHPEFFNAWFTNRFSSVMTETVLQLDFALAISDYVAGEARRLMQQSGFPNIPVRAIPLAHTIDPGATAPAPHTPAPHTDDWTWPIIGLRDQEFVLSVASIQVHKNHINLVQAWRILQKQGVTLPILVIAGERGHAVDDLFKLLDETSYLDGHVMIIEGLTDTELVTLYRNCLFTMFPSIAEGWGLPVGESLIYGKLCIASKTTSMPEVGGEFALYLDPFDASSTARIVRRLLEDRAELQRLEAAIRTRFRPRTWHQFAAAFLRAADTLGRRKRPSAPQSRLSLPPGQAVRPCAVPQISWLHGTALPPYEEISAQALRRLVLAHGWQAPAAWGSEMDAGRAGVSLAVQSPPGSRIRLALQMRGLSSAVGLRVVARSQCGGRASARVPKQANAAFLLCLDCVVDAAGRTEIAIEVTGANPAVKQPPGIGLVKILYLTVDETSDRIVADSFVPIGVPREWSAATQLLAPVGDRAEALRRRAILASGWLGPEPWGALMDGGSGELTFAVAAQPGEDIRLALQLRGGTSPRGATVTARAGCGAQATIPLPSEGWTTLLLWLDCKVPPDCRLHVVLEIHGRRAGGEVARLGIVGLAFGRRRGAEGWRALSDALQFSPTLPPADDLRAALRDRLHFTVTGHVNGSYSLASVNRCMALALGQSFPGRVRLEQVEGNFTVDHADLPPHQQAAIKRLAATPLRDDVPEVVIAQHYPLWVPPRPGDLPLALLVWEESHIPHDLVRKLNAGFRGVLVTTPSQAKIMVDSGVRVPVRTVGFAPDLDAFLAIGAWRAATRTQRRVSKSSPFVFLHVSSCFPRKGVDVLLQAYAKGFRAADPVRLVIKGFPNPHNDVAEQIARLRAEDPGIGDIVFLNRDMPAKAVQDLFASSDAMVLPTRGEGFNIPAAEALAAGLPLIVTDFGAQVDFTGPDVARMVDFDFAQAESHLKSTGSMWVDPRVDDLTDAMREIYAADRRAHAAEALAERVRRGRDVAALVGDRAAYATRVAEGALDLLMQQSRAAPQVAWITTWKVRCGLAEYSRLLLSYYPNAADDVTVLCDLRTRPADLAAGAGPRARATWRLHDKASIEGLAREIDATGAAVVVIQHHYGLISIPLLASLLADPRLRERKVVITLHNVQDIDQASASDFRDVIAALASVRRVLVHSVNDLNILKSHGLVDNVARFPHGVEVPDIAPQAARSLTPSDAPLIGAHGFFLPHKGYHRLIEAFHILRRDFPQARLRLVAAIYPVPESKDEYQRCQVLAESLGLADAIEWLTDFLPQEEVLARLNECDVIAVPYQHTNESSSGAVRFAIASGAPVMVTPLAIFDDVDNAVIRFHGIEAADIAGGLNWLLHEDPGHRERIQANAQAWLHENSWEVLADRLHGMLTAIAAE